MAGEGASLEMVWTLGTGNTWTRHPGDRGTGLRGGAGGRGDDPPWNWRLGGMCQEGGERSC